MLQEKAQDRERLLLKFIKIMKVGTCPCRPSRSPHPLTAPHSGLCAPARHPHLSPTVAQHLRKLNNFNSYLAILSALDSAPIRRLEWQKQTSEVSWDPVRARDDSWEDQEQGRARGGEWEAGRAGGGGPAVSPGSG